jgi:hypothetical protein
MKNQMMAFLALPFALSFTGCASKHKAQDVDTEIKNSAAVDSTAVVGVKDGNMVYQRKVLMNEELRKLEIEVYNLEAKVYGGPRYNDNRGLYGVLKDCRAETSESKNGGDGKLLWTEKREYVTAPDDFSQIGLEKKKDIVGLTEEFLKDRLDRFKTYKSTLEGRQEEYETKVKMCELTLKEHKKSND